MTGLRDLVDPSFAKKFPALGPFTRKLSDLVLKYRFELSFLGEGISRTNHWKKFPIFIAALRSNFHYTIVHSQFFLPCFLQVSIPIDLTKDVLMIFYNKKRENGCHIMLHNS